MKKLTILFCLLLSMSLLGQQNDVQIFTTERVVGKNLINNTEIKGKNYIFSRAIHKVLVNERAGILTVELKLPEGAIFSKTDVMGYDMNRDSLLWSRRLNPDNIEQFEDFILKTYYVKQLPGFPRIVCLDNQTGETLWEKKAASYYNYSLEGKNSSISYNPEKSSSFDMTLQGIDLKDGKPLWERKEKIENLVVCDTVVRLNDTTVIMVNDGLHTIDLATGKGWSYDTRTGVSKRNVLNLTYSVPTFSNILSDSTYLYFASATQLAKIDQQTGAIVWQEPLSVLKSSKSFLFMDKNLIHLINYGYSDYYDIKSITGEAFIGTYDAFTGHQQSFMSLNQYQSPINDHVHRSDCDYLLFKKNILRYSRTGKLTNLAEFPKKKYGKLIKFLGENVWKLNENGEPMNIMVTDTSNLYVLTDRDKVLKLDQGLNVIATISRADVYDCYLEIDMYRFMHNGRKTVIIDMEGNPVANFQASGNAFLIGNTLYAKRGKILSAIELKDIITN